MRKSELVEAIASQTGQPKTEVLFTVEALMKEVADTLSRGEDVFLRGFGSFICKKRNAKIGRNILAGTVVEIPEHYIASFKPSKELKDRMKGSDVGKAVPPAPIDHGVDQNKATEEDFHKPLPF